MVESIAFAELLTFMKDKENDMSSVAIFKLADLVQQYETQLSRLGVIDYPKVHSTRLKQRLMMHCPSLKCFTKGKDVMLAFHRDVCPPQMCHGLFTTAAVDNVDHNPSANTSKDAFHGTTISLFQHPENDSFLPRNSFFDFEQISTRSNDKLRLPIWYTCVTPLQSLNSENFVLPSYTDPFQISRPVLLTGFSTEYEWIDHVMGSIDMSDIPNDCGWAAFHSRNLSSVPIKSLNSLLPLLPDSPNSPSMIRHSMDIVMKAVEHVNPGQTPVIAFDQPLFAIAKQIQWSWPDRYGEQRLVIMFGGLHIEQAALKMIGEWLRGSGWSDVLVQSGVAKCGTADGFLNVVHIKKARYAHQLFAVALRIMQKKAFENTGLDSCQFDHWSAEQCSSYPQFCYWDMTYKLELLILVFVKSVRLSDFNLYCAAIHELLPWFFALDRTNYARWLPVHLKDMLSLSQSSPDVARSFSDGKFTVQKSNNVFSSIAIDHAHEQNNKQVKGDGGAIGLMGNGSALCRWMLGGPEVARLIDEFEAGHGITDKLSTLHHENKSSTQVRFKRDLQSLLSSLEELGNPFEENSGDLISLCSKAICDPSVLSTVEEIDSIGRKQLIQFIEERLTSRTKSIMDVIPRNKLALFKDRTPPIGPNKVLGLKSDVKLFSRLYVACQTRTGNMDEFFSHENQPYPPALSNNGGSMRHSVKSDIISCLQKLVKDDNTVPVVSAIVLDGAVVVQMLRPSADQTFRQYSEEIFLPYIERYTRKAIRVDVVWDEYRNGSLKEATREQRGSGLRQRVLPDVKVPSNWQSFLRVNENKNELFEFLSVQLLANFSKHVVVTLGKTAVSNHQHDISMISPCSQEEADTRLMLHCSDAVRSGHGKVCIRTVDSDVVAIAVGVFDSLQAEELWIAFGTGKKYRYIPVHELVACLGLHKAKALPFFHAFTGCDTTSSFSSRGKKSAWDVWQSFPTATHAFLSVMENPNAIDECFPILQRFVVLLYDRCSTASEVNECRKQLFTKKDRGLDSIPPTSDALMQHVKRVTYQAAFVWKTCLVKEPTLPDPQMWGWSLVKQSYQPTWTTIPPATDCCKELIRCSCKKGCKKNCSCVRNGLPCTGLCGCDGDCASPS